MSFVFGMSGLSFESEIMLGVRGVTALTEQGWLTEELSGSDTITIAAGGDL